MNFGYKRLWVHFGVLSGFFFTLEAFNGTFEKSYRCKPVRISLSSQNFMKEVMPIEVQILSKMVSAGADLQPNVLLPSPTIIVVKSMIDWSYKLTCQEFFAVDDIVDVQKIIAEEKRLLFDMISVQAAGAKNGSRSGKSLVCAGNELEVLLQNVESALRVVNVRGFERDMGLIKNFITELRRTMLQSDCDWLLVQTGSLRILAIISGIVACCDGVFITDYDVVILSHAALVLFLIARGA